jgi:hypothetical protein
LPDEHFPEEWTPVSAGNATKYKELERFPIQGNREAL